MVINWMKTGNRWAGRGAAVKEQKRLTGLGFRAEIVSEKVKGKDNKLSVTKWGVKYGF